MTTNIFSFPITGCHSILLSDNGPFLLMYFLSAAPFLLYTPSLIFPINPIVSQEMHFLFMIAFGIFLFSAVTFGRLMAVYTGAPRSNNYRSMEWANTPYYRRLLFGILSVSLTSHVYVVLVGLFEFRHTGYDGAREVLSIDGIGIFLRLYIISIPILVSIGERGRTFQYLVRTLIALIIARSFILSERTAIIELLIVGWVTVKILGLPISRNILVAIIMLFGTLFPYILYSRLKYQSDYNIDIANESVLNTTLLYYADTINKFYLTILNGFHYELQSWNALIEKLVSSDSLGSRDWQAMYESLSDASIGVVRALNNPGGAAQDISDFGAYGGILLIYIKFAMCAFSIKKAQTSLIFLAISPLCILQVIEYPRFNYLYLPFAAILLALAIGIGFLGRVFPSFSSRGFYQ